MNDAEAANREEEQQENEVGAVLQDLFSAERRCPFGPRFFLEPIPAFLRDHSPDSPIQARTSTPDPRLADDLHQLSGPRLTVAGVDAIDQPQLRLRLRRQRRRRLVGAVSRGMEDHGGGRRPRP